jgi:hypothetical protein
MRVNYLRIAVPSVSRVRARLSSESGFTMLIALGVLAVTALLAAAVFVAVQGDVHNTQHDLDQKRAYAAASAGVNSFLYQLNQNPSYWGTCPNDNLAQTPVPGSSTGALYAYQPIYNPGFSASNCSADPTSAMISGPGTLNMEFGGYSGNASLNQQVGRAIVATFRKDSPFDFVWYTVYEALDPSINGFTGCNVWYRQGRQANCNIVWVSGDVINGPMYTQDQYLINPGASPTFGRGPADKIESAAPGTSAANICSGNNCGSANIVGKAVPNAGIISLPPTNAQLLTDATNHGTVFSGTTTITLNGTSATVVNCPSNVATDPCTTSTVNATSTPIIYVQNAASCSPPQYTPFGSTYPTNSSGNYYGCSGDVYVSGNYTGPLTIASANNIIVDGNITTNTGQTGNTAVLGLVANEFIRVMHGVTARGSAFQQCSSNQVTATNIPSQTFPNITIDAAIMAVQHSFIVDNYDCGAQIGNITVTGAIAQYFRGTVGTTSGTGYLKKYAYDNRLELLLPPYLFDISSSGWHVIRETLCTPGAPSSSSTGCQIPLPAGTAP